MTRSRKALFGLLTGLLVCTVIEGASHVALHVLASDPRFTFIPVEQRLRSQTERLREMLAPAVGRLTQLDPEIGWIYAPGVRAGSYTSTAQGVRGTRLYTREKSRGTVRLAAFGDSFVHANEVGDEEAWSRRLELLDSHVEVLNYGVGGYGTDQALLLYERRGRELDPDVVMLGFTDVVFARNVNRYQGFRSASELPLFKPRFRIGSSGELELLPIPFPGEAGARRLIADPRAVLEAAPYDWFFEPLVWRNPLYDHVAFVRLSSSVASKLWQSRVRHDRFYRGDLMNEEAEAFTLLVALIREFAREVEASGARFLLVVFPRRESDLWGAGPRAYAPLLRAVEDLWVVDLGDSLSSHFEDDHRALFAPGDHFSAAGNEVVAETLLQELRARGFVESRP